MKHEYHANSIRRRAVASFLLAGSLLLAACGGADTSQGSAATTAAGQLAATAVATTATTGATAEATAAPTTAATIDATTEATAEATTEAAAVTTVEATAADSAAAVQKLNLNEVAPEQLRATIPNFGDRMVREFMEYRPYVSIQQFRREIGKYVDEAQVAEYEKYVYVPVNVNEADEATLQQLPGVDAATAAELVAGRPYASNQAFLDKLAQVAPQSDAAAYLEGE